MKYYAGIGSRRTPNNILAIMRRVASKLEQDGWILRSGGAKGADRAFESGVKYLRNKEIYLPTGNISQEAYDSVAQFHPYPQSLNKDYIIKLMARNYHQVMGPGNGSPRSKFIVCYTPDGCKSNQERTRDTGGTGQAISIADHYGIPIYNLAVEEDLNKILGYLNK